MTAMKKTRGDELADGHLAGEAVRKTVRAQIRGKEPPEAEQAYRRLKHEGYSDGEAVELIAAVLAAEIFYVLSEQSEHDPARYAKMLRRLPELPHDSDA
jgi:hypothetical protein